MRTPLGVGAVAALLVLAAACQQPTSAPKTPAPVAQEVTVGPGAWTTDTAVGKAWALTPDTDLGKTRRVTLSVTLPPAWTQLFELYTNTSAVASATAQLSGSVASPRRAGRSTTAPRRLHLADLRPVTAVAPSVRPLVRTGLSASTSPAPTVYALGAALTFTDSLWTTSPGSANQHPSHLRSQTDSADGHHHLNVWVADDCWQARASQGSGSAHAVTQAMVDALADRFLTTSSATPIADVYHWDTDLLGAEWPASGAPAGYDGVLIDSGGTIDIFLCNLNPGVPGQGVLLGYFHALNNLLATVPGSAGTNQRELFALDADSLATPDTSAAWSLGAYWPGEIVSTLAHEFQHMIHYYQKQVKNHLTVDTDTWINEMASLMTEDLVADKLGTLGPRGIAGVDYTTGPSGNTDGRLPEFNYWHESIGLTGWGDGVNGSVLDSYASAYAFGAWLLRNYGGPSLLNDLVTNDLTDENAVVHAVRASPGAGSETYLSLVKRWGLATFLAASSAGSGLNYASTGTNPGLGAFAWTFPSSGGRAYALGSIDLGRYRYNYTGGYSEGPYVYQGAVPAGQAVYPGATLFLRRGTYAPGTTLSYTVTLPPGVAFTLGAAP